MGLADSKKLITFEKRTRLTQQAICFWQQRHKISGPFLCRNRKDGLEVSLDDPLVCRQKETKKSDQRTDKRNICKPIYPSWQQPRTEIKGWHVELLIAGAILSLVFIIVLICVILNWSKKMCCKAKVRDFNFSMSMYDTDSQHEVVVRESNSSEGDNRNAASVIFRQSSNTNTTKSEDNNKSVANVILRQSSNTNTD